ncbi:tetratricopeptide repeat protein [Actinomadura kijaniata]|uniref:tetratricopeptide repeat protein n=1 Tax=Actinomadura kijaniata TaxID=46161 RepID=UPI00082BBB88|nr:tetratricopeptide repeat protein [Actinomadura kijaniata]
MAEEREGFLRLQEALRALEAQAVMARKARGRPHSRREAAREARRFHTDVDARRIGEWLRRDDGRAPRDPDQVWALVRVWCGWAGREPARDERRYWNRLVEEARPRRADRTGGVGLPLSLWSDPLALEVHPAIEHAGRGLPALPAYVRRGHDDALGEAVRGARERSAMAVLVGEAATGKTRACWEALGLLPEDWRLWHPIAPSRPRAALRDLPSVGPRTVVWLNDLQHYLLTPGGDLGEQVAAELRALLRDPGRGPVLVLGTLWPRHWATLTGYHSPEEDPHAQARALLAGHGIVVPTTFSPLELDRARAVAEEDPRLAEAVGNAEDGHLAQYLAGGPALQMIYRTAAPPARALLDAAIDARRLGHGPLLPRRLLLDAARGYLTRPQWEMLEEGWPDTAFSQATDHRPCRGARAPLTPVRPAPGDGGGGEPRYRLADYLEQLGQAERRTLPVPGALWASLLAHAAGPDLIRLGRQAQERGLYRLALDFYRAAWETDPEGTDAMLWSGDLHRNAGRVAEALSCYRRAAEGGDPYAWHRAAETLRGVGRVDEALWWYDRAVADGLSDALTDAADALIEAHRPDEAEPLLRRAVRAGVEQAAGRLGERLLRRGAVDEAVRCFQEGARSGETLSLNRTVALMTERDGRDAAVAWLASHRPGGAARTAAVIGDLLWRSGDRSGAIDAVLPHCAADPALMRTAARWSADEGRRDEAIALCRRAAEGGDTGAMREAARLLEAAGRVSEAIGWLRERADGGDRAASRQAVAAALRAGCPQAVLPWLEDKAERGDATALWHLMDLLARTGRTPDALAAYERFRGAPGVAGVRRRADLLHDAGRLDEAIACYRAAADDGDDLALVRAVHLMGEAGRPEEAVAWLRSRAERGDPTALRWVIDLLLGLGRADEAIEWLRVRVEDGDADALGWVANLLRDADRVDEALAYYLRGAEAGMAAPDPGDEDTGALALAAALLRRAGRHDEAVRVVRDGLEPEGRIAHAAAFAGP